MSKTFPVNIKHKPTYSITHSCQKKNEHIYVFGGKAGAEAIFNQAAGEKTLRWNGGCRYSQLFLHCKEFALHIFFTNLIKIFPFLLVCALPSSLNYVMR